MRKTLLLPLSVAFLLLFTTCRKNKTDQNDLPPATQTGKNTLGFMLNGEPWKPQGVRGTGNLSIDFDFGFKQGIFGIVAYNFIPTNSEQLTIGVRDSLNFMNAPFTITLNKNSLYVISFSKDCEYFSTLTDVESSGTLTVSKLDKTNRIIAATFNATLSKNGCETIKITDGRFDMKF